MLFAIARVSAFKIIAIEKLTIMAHFPDRCSKIVISHQSFVIGHSDKGKITNNQGQMIDLFPIWISLKTAIVATSITFFLGIAAARWMLGYRGTGKGLIDGIFTSPLVLPPTVVGFILLLALGKNSPIGQFLNQIGITVIFTWYATVIAATVVAFPLMYKTALGAFKQIDTNLLACARTLGASEWIVFWRVLLPLAKPGLIAGTLLSFARALGEFGATLMLAGSIPGKTQTIPVAIFFAAESGAMDEALIWVLAILTISLGIIWTVNYWTEDVASSQIPSRTKKKRDRLKSIKLTLPKFIAFLKRLNPLVTPSLLSPILAESLNPKLAMSALTVSSPQPKTLISTFQTSNIKPQTPNPKYKTQLLVEIQKQLPCFCLDVSFKTEGEPLGLLGASGAGKSMILRCIAGLETPDRGRIVLNGKILFDSDQKINLPTCDRHIGFLFQNYALFPHLTVAENIAFGLPDGLSNLAIKQRVEAQLIAVELAELGDRYPGELSGGQQQRVALARALASKPEILLLDEPFSALDTYLRDRLEKLLRTLLTDYPGETLFVTHNLEEAYRICPNLLVMEEGKIAAFGAKQQIFDRPLSRRVAQLTGCKNFSRAVALSSRQIQALDWGCTLTTIDPISTAIDSVGIRAYKLIFTDDDLLENTFPCWLVATSETPQRMTLYLRLNSAPNSPEDYHLQAEVFKDKWESLKGRSFPWFVQLHPRRILVLPDFNNFYSSMSDVA
jgi:molybdate ABC transporter permease protein